MHPALKKSLLIPIVFLSFYGVFLLFKYLALISTPFPQNPLPPKIPEPQHVFPLLKQSIQEENLDLFVSLLSEDTRAHYDPSFIQEKFVQLCIQARHSVDSAQLVSLTELSQEVNGKRACKMCISFDVPFMASRRNEDILVMLEQNTWKICYPCYLYQQTGPQTMVSVKQN